jgi:ascorbate-specific PTS system EIIC-type component UlaA
MSKKNRPKAPPALPQETQAAEAMTIGWMVAVMAAVVCELGVIVAKVASNRWPDEKRIGMTGELLMFAAAAVGLVVLALIPLVYKARIAKPPRAVTIFAAIIGAGPWLVIVAQLFLQKRV